MRIALAQIDCALGDIPENVRRVREALARARAEDADLVVFPELALTGYSIGQADEDVARSLDDPELAGLLADTEEVACVVGFAEAGPVHTYNSTAYLERGAVCHVHRKVHLPTYDIWEERKHFTPGGAMRAFDARAGRMAILLCGDAWQPVLAVARRPGRRARAHRPGREHHRRPRGHRARVARDHALLRAHAAVLRRLRQSRRDRARAALLGRLAHPRPVGRHRRQGASRRARDRCPPRSTSARSAAGGASIR